MQPEYVILESIRETVDDVGPENFSSEAPYNHLHSFTITVDGCQQSLTETKRTSVNCLGLYELRSAKKELFRVTPEWYPVIHEP